MYTLSAPAENTIQRSHAAKIRATAFGATVGMLEGLPISGGEVVVDAKSQVRRTATVTVADPSLWPANPLDILSPFGAELLVEYGVVISRTRTEWIPLIRGVISEADRARSFQASDGVVSLTLSDRSIKVAEDRFDAPTQTVSGATTVAEITRLIQQTLPTATVIDKTGSTQVAAVMEIERERWADGIEKLADSLGAEVFCDPTGNFVIRYQPQITDATVWEIKSGPGGILVRKDEKLTRDTVYNRVVATGERVDGTPPVRDGVSDTDPLSPTFYGGSFGRKPRFYSSPLLTTTGQCTTAATAILARAKGIQASVTIQSITNPALDAGDVIRVVDQGRTQTHIIDRVTIPLSVTETQQITTRSLDLEP